VADGRETSGWATGFILFAGLMMIMVGIWQALEGLVLQPEIVTLRGGMLRGDDHRCLVAAMPG
jgi:hypothetical protein